VIHGRHLLPQFYHIHPVNATGRPVSAIFANTKRPVFIIISIIV